MKSRIGLILIKEGQGYDISNLVKRIKWSGRKGSSSRNIQVEITDDDGYKHAQSELDVEEGHQCLFLYDGKELFRGIVMKQVQNSRKLLSFTAYDNGIYLANNRDTFTYENKTASEIFKDVCTRFGMPIGEVSECTYKIPDLTKRQTTAFDVIADAMSLDFDATSIRHYVSSDKGVLNFITRRENILQWVIESGKNLYSYSYQKSIENVRTRIRMLSDEGKVLAEATNGELENKIGVMQDIEKPDETLSAAQVQELCKSILEEKNTPTRTLTLESIGIAEVVSGMGVFVIIKSLGISRTFYVDDDTHTFDGNKHTMSLKLNYANDISKEVPGTGNAKEYNVGDVVQFGGGYHYNSSSASNPTGSECSAGPARVTLIAKGAKHPYHLVNTDGTTRVYGWVDSGSFR